MPSKTLWFNKELILQIIRSVGWIAIVHFLTLIFALPLRMLQLYTDEKLILFQEPVDSLFQYHMEVQIGLLVAIPVILTVFLFRFLHVKQAAELMHSLPLKRESIFHHYAVSGMFALILPVLFIALIVMIMHDSLNLNEYFQIKDILIWTGTTILLNLLIFSAGVFVAMMTGISAVQGVLTYIFLLFPAGIIVLLVENVSHFLYGFPVDYFLNSSMEKMSPFIYIRMIDERPLQWEEAMIYTISIVILYGLSLYFYKKRKIESASEAIAFPKLRLIFKYGVTFCMMLLGGMYFIGTESNSRGWIIVGYLIGAIIGYYVAEMVLQKTWRVFRKVKGLLIYSVAMTAVIMAIQTLNVYENKVPEQTEIKNVVFTNNMYQQMYGNTFTPEHLKEPANIEAVRKLHQQIIANKDQDKSEEYQYETYFFQYELKNGHHITRQYNVNTSLYSETYKLIYEAKEYKRASQEIFHLNKDKIDYLTITAANSPLNKYATIKNPEAIKEFIEIFKSDVLAESYEDSVYYQDATGSSIEFFIDPYHSIHLNIKPTYKGVEQWLAEKDLLERTRVMPEDVASIQIVKENDKLKMDREEIAAAFENRTDGLKVDDKDKITELLSSMSLNPQFQQYVVVLRYVGSDYPEIYYMNEKHAPDFVKQYFQ